MQNLNSQKIFSITHQTTLIVMVIFLPSNCSCWLQIFFPLFSMDYRTGDLITEAEANTRVFFWEITNTLYFRVKEHIDHSFHHYQDCITIKVHFNYNLRRSLRLHKCWLFFTIWTFLHPLSDSFLHVFCCNVMNFLHSFSVISINSVIRSVVHFVPGLIVISLMYRIPHMFSLIYFNLD